MNAGMLLTCALSLLAIQSPKVSTAPGSSGGGNQQLVAPIHIRAWIDGRSWLILDDDTATWLHFDFAAPGRLNCDTGAQTESTFLDGVAWDPVWPDLPTCENRDCSCSSSTFTGLLTPVPNADFTPVLVPIQVRGTSAIVEYPSAANGYRVVIEFDDDHWGAADWYEVDLALSDCGATNYCASTLNSTGAAATISVTGSFAIGANDTQLRVSSCPPDRPGMFFYGATPTQIPMADGYLCVSPFSPGLFRIAPAVHVDPNGTAQVALDFGHAPAGGEILEGSTWYFQFWFRDPAAGGTGSNLSDAARVTFCP